MSLEEFRAWERKCLSEAVTNAARLRSRQSGVAAAPKSSTDGGAASEPDGKRGADGAAPLQQKG
jgi:hypothetical protein